MIWVVSHARSSRRGANLLVFWINTGGPFGFDENWMADCNIRRVSRVFDLGPQHSSGLLANWAGRFFRRIDREEIFERGWFMRVRSFLRVRHNLDDESSLRYRNQRR